ncbi:MAG: hypothetical protein QG671_2514 [Actinomycetota bacterium]|nr:hypothetical protein [Actinomycetota bacterium]
MATSTLTITETDNSVDVSRRVVAGAAGGLVGGVVFGMMMQVMDMIPMVAMMVGSESIVVGWGLHLAISVALGVGFGLVSVRGLDSWGRGIGMGVGYGVAWWVMGALLLMPAKLGMPVFMLNTMAWQSLMGHMIFGAVLGVVAVAVIRKGADRA